MLMKIGFESLLDCEFRIQDKFSRFEYIYISFVMLQLSASIDSFRLN